MTVVNSIKNITKLPFFTRRWPRVSSIEIAVNTRYNLPHITIDKGTINRHLGKCDPNVDNLSHSHESGIYRVRKNNEYHYYFDSASKLAPTFPNFRDRMAWNTIDKIDSECLDEYINHLSHLKERERTKKRKRLDSIDHISITKMHELKTDEIVKRHIENNDIIHSISYWDSPEAQLLFCPKNNETVINYLCRRETLLRVALADDDELDHIVNDPKLLAKTA